MTDYTKPLFLWILILHVSADSQFNLYMCSWPLAELKQIRCEYRNCPYIQIDEIYASRLDGDPNTCMDLNADESTRKPIPGCKYKLDENGGENRDFLIQVKKNCSRKSLCEIQTRKGLHEPLQNAGYCGKNPPNTMRNWLHIKYSCVGDIEDIECTEEKLRTTTLSSTLLPVTTTTNRTTVTYKLLDINAGKKPSTDAPLHLVVTLIVPILGTLIFLTMVLIIITICYRRGMCCRKSWKKTAEEYLKSQMHLKSLGYNNNNQIKPESFTKVDLSKIKDLEKQLSRERISTDNVYFTDLGLRGQDETDFKSLNKRERRSSLELKNRPKSLPLPAEMYFSDSSVSTTTAEDYDSQGRKKKKHIPLPPLPKPVVRHSEVYFTETETESEAPPSKRKEPLPRLDPPPKSLRNERTKQNKSHSDINNCSHNSLDLALTKLASRKLTAQEQRAKLATGKKPQTKPRPLRPSSLTLPVNASLSVYPPGLSEQTQTKRGHSINVPPESLYKNIQ